jgi:hypothetical protein
LQMLCQSVAGDGFTCSSFVCRLRWCDSCRHGHCRWAPAEPSARAAPPTPESPGTPVEDAQVYGRRSRREAGQSHLSAGGTSERCCGHAPRQQAPIFGVSLPSTSTARVQHCDDDDLGRGRAGLPGRSCVTPHILHPHPVRIASLCTSPNSSGQANRQLSRHSMRARAELLQRNKHFCDAASLLSMLS